MLESKNKWPVESFSKFDVKLSTGRPVPASWKWDPWDPGRAGLYVREEAELLFFDPTGHGGARDPT